jgi:hypothetical protein
MRPVLKAALAVALLPMIAASPALAQTISVDTLRTVTRTLSSDEYEGRAPASAGEDKTIAYLIDRMKAAGLQPGNKGSWTQDVPLVEITATMSRR